MANRTEFKDSKQLAIRLPKEVYARAMQIGPKPTIAIVAALRQFWAIPEVPDKKGKKP